MPREAVSQQTFNRGKLSKQGLARVDLDRTKLSAEIQTNYVPKVLGPMTLRPGFGFIGATYQNKKAFHIPFVAATDDTALIELTDTNMRIRINDVIVSRIAVSTAITNPNFDTDLTGWTDADQSGTTSEWVTGGYLGMAGTGFNKAIRQQTLTISGSDQNKEHALRIVVALGKISVKIGTVSGGDDILSADDLVPGTHSLTFTPIRTPIFLELSSYTTYESLISSINIESAGDMVVPTIWPENILTQIRFAQSIDVIFCAAYGFRPQRIERRSPRSWSVVDYITEDGPYRVQNINNNITLTPSALNGNITLTASQNLFTTTNVGSLYSITSIGQTVTGSLTADGQFTNYVKVIGVGSSRNITVTRSGTWSGTITLQRSLTDTSSPANTTTTFTGNGTTTFNDALDNEIVYYRVGFDTGGYVSGTAVVTITYSSGGLTGVVRITAFASATSVSAVILTSLGGIGASSNWAEGLWSDRRGFPSSVAFYEGRLWWAGKSTVVGSVSDAYDSFDPAVIGDAGPINRTIGEGPIDKINYILPLQRLLLGGQGSEFSIRSSAFDEIITPSNFNIKTVSTQGSDAVAAVKIDNQGLFAQQGGTRLFQFTYNSDIFDYQVQEVTTLVPEQCQAGILKMVVQRKPDTRVHCVLADGTVSLLVFDQAEDVNAWVDITSTGASGFIEDIVILPGSIEDSVYYVVMRTINGSAVRYLEKWAQESECIGGTINKLADSFVLYSGVATTSIPGFSHLEGATVIVWADGAYVGDYVVSGGVITLSVAAANVVAGLTYIAQFKSVKLAYAAEGGTALNRYKRITDISFIGLNLHASGVKYAGDFDHLQDMPQVENGADVDPDFIWDTYDNGTMSFDGDWNTDSRICLQSQAPKPATLLCITFTVETNG